MEKIKDSHMEIQVLPEKLKEEVKAEAAKRFSDVNKKRILNFFSRLINMMVAALRTIGVTWTRIICAVVSFIVGIYALLLVHDSLTTRFIRIAFIAVMFIQIFLICCGSSGFFRYKDFYVLIAITYMSVIANLMDIIQKVSEDFMKWEIFCFVFLLSQCIVLSFVVGVLDARQPKKTMFTLNKKKPLNEDCNETRKGHERIVPVTQTEENEPLSQQLNIPQDIGAVGGEDIEMTTLSTVVDVHAVEERSTPQIHETLGVNLSLQEDRESQSTQNTEKLSSAQSNLESNSAESKRATSTEKSHPTKTMSPSTGAVRKVVKGKFIVSGVNEDDKSITRKKLTNHNQPKNNEPTSLESTDAQLSVSLTSNNDNLEPFNDSTDNLPDSDRQNISDENLPSGETPNKSISNQSHPNLKPALRSPSKSEGCISGNLSFSPKKISFRYPFEEHLPSFLSVDPNLPKDILKNLRGKPDTISSKKTITIFESVGDRKTNIVRRFENEANIVYEPKKKNVNELVDIEGEAENKQKSLADLKPKKKFMNFKK